MRLTDTENGVLNPLGYNAVRNFPVYGNIVWGARTLDGADQFASDYKYIPVRRLTNFIEQSLYNGTKWAVFEPNDATLWASFRLNVGAFIAGLAQQGAFYRYYVVCDDTTTTPADIERGICNIVVAFAPVKPVNSSSSRSSSSPVSPRRRRVQTASSRISRQRAAVRSVQEFSLPGEVGQRLRRRDQQGQRVVA